MNQFIQVTPVLKPTTEITLITIDISSDYLGYRWSSDVMQHEDFVSQHLHFITGENQNFNGQECVVMSEDERIFKYSGYNGNSKWRKIIASTDKSLNLPSIDEEFIMFFCNNDGKVKVLVEQVVRPVSDYAIRNIGFEHEFILESESTVPGSFYLKGIEERVFNYHGDGYSLAYDIELVPRVKDGKIVIRKSTDTYTRDEVANKIREYAHYRGSWNPSKGKALSLEDWIFENV